MTTNHVELQIGGMTCASCATRIEKKLNKIDGVTATVNFATEKARVDFVGEVSADRLVQTIEQAGYTAELPTPESTEAPAGSAVEDPTASLRRRMLISLALTVPVIAMAMIPALQFTNWQWLSLTLAAPVIVWGAWPFHQAAWSNFRHGTATMDTLISMGTIAAFGWSIYALFWGTAGMPGMTHPFERPSRAPTGPAISILRLPLASRHSSWLAATSRPAPNAAPAPHCGRCSNWVPRTSPSVETMWNNAFRSTSFQSATSSSFVPARRLLPMA
jgi:copper chaperone CopZ